MLGNVFEWTHGGHGQYSSDATDPTGPTSGSWRVYRGGSWSSDARRVRAAYRSAGPGGRDRILGLRPARSFP